MGQRLLGHHHGAEVVDVEGVHVVLHRQVPQLHAGLGVCHPGVADHDVKSFRFVNYRNQFKCDDICLLLTFKVLNSLDNCRLGTFHVR